MVVWVNANNCIQFCSWSNVHNWSPGQSIFRCRAVSFSEILSILSSINTVSVLTACPSACSESFAYTVNIMLQYFFGFQFNADLPVKSFYWFIKLTLVWPPSAISCTTPRPLRSSGVDLLAVLRRRSKHAKKAYRYCRCVLWNKVRADPR